MEKENRILEYKREITNTFLKTVSAYANYQTGRIIFGISDDLRIIGLDHLLDKCSIIENKINDSIEPNPNFSLSIDSNNKLIELTVKEGINKPYLYNGKAYKRNDSSTIEVDRIELKRLILEGSNISFDQVRSYNQQLGFKYFSKKLIEVLKLKQFNEDTLKTLELYSDSNGFNNAANILSDDNSFKGIDFVRFGNSINEILDRETLDNISIIEQFDRGMEIFTKYYEKEVISSKSREKIERIPSLAFKEALANALIHKTYDTDAYILVRMFEDRIEINSPGTLPSGISENDYLNGQVSIFRNPILGNIFFRLHIIEKLGTGILRINDAYQKYDVNPVYKVYDSSVSVVLPCVDVKIPLTVEEEKIKYMLSSTLLSRKDIEEKLDFKKDKTIRLINNMIEKDVIEKIGNNKDIKYRLK